MAEYLILFVMILLLLMFFFIWQDVKANRIELDFIQRQLNDAPYKVEPAEEEKVEEPVHATVDEVNEETYNQMMAEWMGIPIEQLKGGDVNGRNQNADNSGRDS